MQLTSNYNLKKPDGTDVVNIEDFNENADIIDTQLKNLNDNKVDKVTGKQLSTNDYTAAEKTKLAGIATGANNYTHPANHPASIITEETNKRFMTDAERTKLSGIAAGANNYVHPASHSASIITQDTNNRFVTDTEKANWNAKETTSGAQTKANTAEANAKLYTDEHSNDDIAHNRYGTATGTNVLVVTLSPALVALKAGISLRFKNTTANTGTVTLNVNGLGAKPVVKNGGVALSAGNLKAGGVYTVCYDGTNFILQGEGGSGNAVASDLLSGKTASTDAGDIVGTMPNRGVFNLGLGASVPAGYYSGGTTPTGKRMMEGTFSSQNGSNIINLGWEPGVVIGNRWYSAEDSMNDFAMVGHFPSKGSIVQKGFDTTSSSVFFIHTLTATGFTIQVAGEGLKISWKAWER